MMSHEEQPEDDVRPGMAERSLILIVRCAPLIFAIGFLAPVFAEALQRLRVPTLDIPPLVLGLLLAGIWGLRATLKGSWV